jgi:hypothetical protein
MSQPPFTDLVAGIDAGFFRRVYRTATVVALVLGLIVWARVSGPAALGWLAGAALSILGLASIEWSIQKFVRPDVTSLKSLAYLSAAKSLLTAVVAMLAFFAAVKGWLSLLWMLPGFAMPHVVIGLKLVGQKLVAQNAKDREISNKNG